MDNDTAYFLKRVQMKMGDTIDLVTAASMIIDDDKRLLAAIQGDRQEATALKKALCIDVYHSIKISEGMNEIFSESFRISDQLRNTFLYGNIR